MAMTCHGRAMASKIASVLSGQRRCQVRRAHSCPVNSKKSPAAATGNSAAISPFSSKPVPIDAPISHAQRRGCVSSSSSARRKPHKASAIVRVRMTSGIRMRVNRKSPMDVAMARPA